MRSQPSTKTRELNVEEALKVAHACVREGLGPTDAVDRCLQQYDLSDEAQQLFMRIGYRDSLDNFLHNYRRSVAENGKAMSQETVARLAGPRRNVGPIINSVLEDVFDKFDLQVANGKSKRLAYFTIEDWRWLMDKHASWAAGHEKRVVAARKVITELEESKAKCVAKLKAEQRRKLATVVEEAWSK